MKTTSIGGKGDIGEVSAFVGVVLLWLRVLVIAALLIGAVHAQTLVTQPTIPSLWAGSQDTTLPLNFILGSVSTIQGTCSSGGNAIACNLFTLTGGATAIVTGEFQYRSRGENIFHHGLGNVRRHGYQSGE